MTTATAPTSGKSGSSAFRKILIPLAFFGLFFALLGVLGVEGKNEEFSPTAEFDLHTWVELGVLSINKAVAYLIAAAVLTMASMIFVASRMSARPNRLQTAVETAYQFTKNNIIGDTMEPQMARKWFPFLMTLFLFIWWSNMIGYLPMPTNTEHPVELFGIEVPSLALYAATANLSVPLVLALVVWVIYHYEGIKEHGPIGYVKSWIPAGTPGWLLPFMFFIELLGQLVRPVSLAVRLFANVLVGHLLLLFMAGGLAVILGFAAIGLVTLPLAVAFFLFEVGLVATLQAFIFASLAATYIGGAVSHDH
jgi:F-type H+-transporting ATPase subunit a